MDWYKDRSFIHKEKLRRCYKVAYVLTLISVTTANLLLNYVVRQVNTLKDLHNPTQTITDTVTCDVLKIFVKSVHVYLYSILFSRN